MVKPKDRLTVEQWFERANQFEVAAHVLMEGRPRDSHLTIGIPHVVLRAFGVEAFLKCLIEMDDNSAPKWHNLFNLFRRIDPKHQRVLRRRWRDEYAPKAKAWNKQKDRGAIVKRLPTSLDGILKLSGDAFVLFRYAPAEGVHGFALMNFPLVIRDYILELKPELKSKLGNIRLVSESKFVEQQNREFDAIAAVLSELNHQAVPLNINFKRPSGMDPRSSPGTTEKK